MEVYVRDEELESKNRSYKFVGNDKIKFSTNNMGIIQIEEYFAQIKSLEQHDAEIRKPLEDTVERLLQEIKDLECLVKLKEQAKQEVIAELKKEVEGLNTKLKIWNRFNSEDYMHKGEDVTDRDYYYYTNGASSVLENDLKYYKQENEKLKQQLAEKDKLLENAIVPKFKVGDVLWYIRCDKVEKFIVYEARCDCVFYYVNEYGVDVDEYKLFATKQEAEEALKKLNKE